MISLMPTYSEYEAAVLAAIRLNPGDTDSMLRQVKAANFVWLDTRMRFRQRVDIIANLMGLPPV